MITKEQFIKLITDNRKHNNRLDEVEDVLGLAIYDCDWVEYGNVLFDEVLNLLFEEEAVDDIPTIRCGIRMERRYLQKL